MLMEKKRERDVCCRCDDDDGSSTEVELGHPGMRKHSTWLLLAEQRLLAYRKEGEPWSWISRKFSGRTQAQYAHAGTWYGIESNRLPPEARLEERP